MRVKFDRKTKQWFKEHTVQQTTVQQCELCKMYFKVSLGHECDKVRRVK